MTALRCGMKRPWVIAHRGVSADFPENTATAFDAACSLPVDGLELDLQLSRDGVVMVYHDRTLKKLGLPRRRVSGLSHAELSKLDAGGWFDHRFSGERLLTLDQVLDRYAGQIPLMLEVKLRGGIRSEKNHRLLIHAVVRTLIARRLTDKVHLLSFGLHLLEVAQALAPNLRCVWNLEKPPKWDTLLRSQVAGLAAVCVNARAMTPDFVRACHDLGTPVLTFTINRAEQAAAAIASGADGLISDRPGWLLGYLDERER
ncbi:MAG: glycerophosphodiester phosphodiesterase [Leptospirillia bacterium]